MQENGIMSSAQGLEKLNHCDNGPIDGVLQGPLRTQLMTYLAYNDLMYSGT